MQRLLKRIVIIVLVIMLAAGQCQTPAYTKESLYSVTKEENADYHSDETLKEEPEELSTQEKTTEPAGQEQTDPSDGEDDNTQEGTSEEKKEEDRSAKEGTSTENREDRPRDKEPVSTEKKEDVKEKEDSKEEDSGREAPREKTAQEKKKTGMTLRSVGSHVDHNVTMPDVTSHYFTRQKEGGNVSSAGGPDLKTVSDEKEAERYIFTSYPEGTRYNFSPSMSGQTKISVHGGKGGVVSLDKVKASNYSTYGAVYASAVGGSAVSCAFDLSACTTDPYAIYTKVGSWYDEETGRTYAVDLKMTITGCLFPDEKIRSKLENQSMEAPYVSFRNDIIGVDAMATDHLRIRLDFLHSGTDEPIKGIRGIVQFCDIDSQQGVDYGKGFEKVLLFDTGSSKIAYSRKGVLDGSIGYAYSEVNQNLNYANMDTTVAGLFSGSSVECAWTLARCDQKDTGGDAKYAAPGGYGIPRGSDEKEAKSYYVQSSAGMMAIRADVGLAPLPSELTKSVYTGEIRAAASRGKSVCKGLKDAGEEFNYVLHTNVAAPSNINKARYTDFALEDEVDALVSVESVKVFAGQASEGEETEDYREVTDAFSIETKSRKTGETMLTVTALEDTVNDPSFYGYSYYVHMHVRVRTTDELSQYGRDISEWYQKDDHMEKEIRQAMKTEGAFCTANTGRLSVVNSSGLKANLISNSTAVMIPREYRVRKVDMDSGQAVEGVTFGLFAGDDSQPVMKAVSDGDGYAVFTESEEERFYRKQAGEGPYVIREISFPESLENVWDRAYGSKLSDPIPSLKKLLPKGMQEEPEEAFAFVNKNIESPPENVRVIKKSRDTGEILSGAVFDLMEWSKEKGDYTKLMTLEEKKETDGKIVYVNGESIKNTMDNLGRYKIVESRPPRGCFLSGQEWTFSLDQGFATEKKEILYEAVGSDRTARGEIIYKNGMQKGILSIHKTNDEGADVRGATFSVTAAEDIYAPWNIDEKGEPAKDARPLVTKGSLVDEIRTDEKGLGRSGEGCELYPGKYLVEETGGAPGHVKNSEPREVEVKAGLDDSKEYFICSLEFDNKVMHPSFAVAKLAEGSRDREGGKVDFDEKSGRYTEEKIPGIYRAGEKVVYRITVTNTGNTRLSRLLLRDDMNRERGNPPQSLAKYVKEGSAGFKVPGDMVLSSRKGKEIRLSWPESEKTSLLLSELDPGDSVSLDYQVILSAGAVGVTDLENAVYVQAKYNDNENQDGEPHYVQVDTRNMKDADGNSLAEDSDRIHAPGIPDLVPTKVADKTSGVNLKEGEISEGIKVSGIYREGEKVTYSIIVKNTGTAAIKEITLEDRMSEELTQVVDARHAGFVFEGEAKDSLYSLKSAKGKKITAKKEGDYKVLLAGSEDPDDRLLPGDYVTLNFQMVILKDAANLFDLVNKAVVSGWYFDGNEDRPVPGGEDEDKISIPGEPAACVAKLADRTTGAVLKDGRYEEQAKITGSYRNSDTVTYKITVTNRGTAALYDMRLTDEMSQELISALEEESITFKDGNYTSLSGKTVRTRKESPFILRLDYLAPGDQVDVYLSADVKADAGNLFSLKNDVSLTARTRQGNEEELAELEEAEEKQGSLIYHANFGRDEMSVDSETPACAGKKIHVNGNPFDNPEGIFGGWSEDTEGEGKIWLPDDVMKLPDGDKHLYAVWIDMDEDEPLPYYRLIYDANDGSGRIAADAENEKPRDYIMKADSNPFTRENYRFDHWNDKLDDSGESYDVDEGITMPDHDKKVYAIWEKIPCYSLTYYSNNGKGLERRDAQTPCQSETAIVVDGNSFNGHNGGKTFRFVNWNTRPDGSGETFEPGSEIVIYGDMQLYAIWEESEEETYHVIYHANDQTTKICAGISSPAEAGEEIEVEENGFIRPGYIFKEWNTLADGSGRSESAGDSFDMPQHDVHLYAIWEKEDGNRLVYHSNDGRDRTCTDGECPGTQVQLDGIMFENAGRLFAGWNEKKDGSGRSLTPGEIIRLEGDLDLYAVWKKKTDHYRLSYSSNWEKNEVEYDSETPALEDSRIEINPCRFVREGYRFVEWNDRADGSGSSYQEGTTFRLPAKDTTLYARWEKEEEAENPTGDDEKPKPPAQVDPSLPSAAEAVRKIVDQDYEELSKMDPDDFFRETGRYQELPQTELMTDRDLIHVPGKADLVTAKLADRTKGVSLQKGRYWGTRSEGSYAPGEKISYEIHVTNRGTADARNILVEDIIADNLLSLLKKKTIRISTGKMKTSGNDTVLVKERTSKKAARAVSLDHLKAGDSLKITMTASLLGNVKAGQGLANTVRVSGEYMDGGDDGSPALVPIPETDLMTDTDTIRTGSPLLKIAKQADRTGGVVLKEGRLTGSRKYGSYRKGEMILYTLTVTNAGNAPAYQVRLSEEPSDRLKKYVQTLGFQVGKGDRIRTDSGAAAKVLSASSTSLILDKLAAGDQVKFVWKMQVKKDVENADLLINKAGVDGKNKDGSDIKHTTLMDDRDKINVKDSGKGKKARQRNKGDDDYHQSSYSSSGSKTGDSSGMSLLLLLLLTSGASAVLILIRHKRQGRKNAGN